MRTKTRALLGGGIMRILFAFMVATALFAISAASVATAKPTFSGERTVDAAGRLHVSFTELGVGKQTLSYRLQATGEVTFTCGGVFYGTGGFGGVSWRDASQHATIQAERGRASGTLWHETLLTSPTCRPDEFGQVPAIGRSAISWTDITVTSTSGAILELEDIAAPTP